MELHDENFRLASSSRTIIITSMEATSDYKDETFAFFNEDDSKKVVDFLIKKKAPVILQRTGCILKLTGRPSILRSLHALFIIEGWL